MFQSNSLSLFLNPYRFALLTLGIQIQGGLNKRGGGVKDHFVTIVPFCDTCTILWLNCTIFDTCTILWQSWTILWQTMLYHFVTPIVPFCVKKKLYHFVTKSYHFMNYEFLLAKSDTFRKLSNFRFINGNFYWFYVQLTLNRLSSCKINTTFSRDQSIMAFK